MSTEHPDTFTFKVITDRVDGNGNQADINGWDFTRYNANPVVFFNHRWNDPPVGKALTLHTQGDHINARIQLAPTQLGEQIALMLADGYIRGASAGWKPLEFDLRMNERGWPVGIHSHKQELLELSIVGLPAHPDTLKAAMDAVVTFEYQVGPIAAAANSLDTIIGSVPNDVLQIPGAELDVLPNFGPNPALDEIIAALKIFNRKHRGSP